MRQSAARTTSSLERWKSEMQRKQHEEICSHKWPGRSTIGLEISKFWGQQKRDEGKHVGKWGAEKTAQVNTMC